MKKVLIGMMILAACLALAACTAGSGSVAGDWREETTAGTDQSDYRLSLEPDGTFEERIEPKNEQASATTVSGQYTVDNGKITFKVTGFSGGGMEAETLMDLGGDNSLERRYEIEGETLYLYESEKQEGRTEKAFEGKFVRAR
ncbi:hypothetical protein [Eubacterium sp. 1001713B170207_170306_E7]|uniref:hypothetical protein n=1 Tax=Eubacterium sp. 1001713B170207_170306_E7 TaxID=2787097 RepID=UPI00189A5A80|nr:hypothetical protein [Eubacterium sp. 1001713B170207_170306_E7]